MAPYDWSTLKTNPKIHETFVIQLNNRFAFLQESVSAPSVNSTYDNFETACRETAKNTIPLKLKTKKRKPWESADICQKRHELHTAAQLKNSLPSHEIVKKFKDTRAALKSSYEAEQTEYLQSKINHIRTTASNKKAAKAWKTVNEISGRKKNTRGKLKASSQEQRLQLWQQHFQDLLGKPPQNSNEQVTPIITGKLKIKKGPFTMEELKLAINRIQNGKACGLDEIPAEVWKLEEFHHTLLDMTNSVYNQDPIARWSEGCLLPFPKKGNLGITTNYRGITLTAIAALDLTT